MAPLTYRDHLRHGFISAEKKLVDFIADGKFFLEIGQCERTPQSPMQEAIAAARLIRASTTEDLWLCLSGGIDSECMARAFLAARVTFRVAIMRFNDDLNWFDIRHAVEFCEKHQLSYQYFDVNILEFYKQGLHLRYAHKYRCTSPQLATHLFLMQQIPGFPIMSWNIVATGLVNGKVSLKLPTDLYFCYHRYFEIERRSGVAFFFLYTPELFYSFYQLPTMRKLLRQQEAMAGREMTYADKCQAYQEAGFEIEPREDKFTGFEQVKIYFEKYFNEEGPVYDRYFRHPLTTLYPPPREVVFKISAEHLFGLRMSCE
jgi:hypothetical protein